MQRGGEWPTRELSHIVREFGFEPLSLAPVRRAWRVDTPEGPRFLKCTTLTAPELAFVAAATSYLRSRGEPAPRLYRDYLDRPWVGRPGFAFVLTDWVEGREAFFADPADLQLMVEAVARLHRRGEGFAAPPASLVRVEWGHWPEKFGRRAAQLEVFRAAAKAAAGDFDRAYLALWPFYAGQARQALRMFERSAYPLLTAAGVRRPVICHHDLSERNFLVNEEEVRLIDFDYCLQDLPAHDLANLLQRQARADGWDVAEARATIFAYRRLRPLTRDECRLLLALLMWPHRYWLLGWQRYVERLAWTEERWRAAAMRRAGEAVDRERFLSALANELGERYQ